MIHTIISADNFYGHQMVQQTVLKGNGAKLFICFNNLQSF